MWFKFKKYSIIPDVFTQFVNVDWKLMEQNKDEVQLLWKRRVQREWKNKRKEGMMFDKWYFIRYSSIHIAVIFIWCLRKQRQRLKVSKHF